MTWRPAQRVDPSRRQAATGIAAAGVTGWVSPTAAQAVKGVTIPAPAPAPPLPGAPQTIETLDDPFRRMTAPVFVNGEGPHFFMVDTGANRSVISQELAAKLALAPAAARALHGVAGMQMVPSAVVDELRLGQRVERQVEMAVLPEAAIGGAGIAGVDRFSQRRLQLDFGERRLVIDPPRQSSPAYTLTVPARKKAGQLMIVDADLGGIKLAAFLDTGAERTIGNPALHKLAVLRGRGSRFADVDVVSVTGQVLTGQMAVLPMLRLGQLRLANITLTFADLHVFSIWGLDQPALMVGVDTLSGFDSITLDFQRSQVRFQLFPSQIGNVVRVKNPASASRIPSKDE